MTLSQPSTRQFIRKLD